MHEERSERGDDDSFEHGDLLRGAKRNLREEHRGSLTARAREHGANAGEPTRPASALLPSSVPRFELSLRLAQLTTGACQGGRLEFENPFQHFVADGDRAKRFSFSDALDLDSNACCLRAGRILKEWTYSPAEAAARAGTVAQSSENSYHGVQVVVGRRWQWSGSLGDGGNGAARHEVVSIRFGA